MSDMPGLQSKIQGVDRAVDNLESAISKSRWAFVVAVVIILVAILMVGNKVKNAYEGVVAQQDQYLSAIESEVTKMRPVLEKDLKEIFEKVKDPLLEAGKTGFDKVKDPLIAEFRDIIDQRSPEFVKLLKTEGETLVTNCAREIRVDATERLADAIGEQDKALADVLKEVELSEVVIHVKNAFQRMGEGLIEQRYIAAIHNMRATWDQFPQKNVHPSEEAAVPMIIKEMFMDMLIQKFTLPMRMYTKKGVTVGGWGDVPPGSDPSLAVPPTQSSDAPPKKKKTGAKRAKTSEEYEKMSDEAEKSK
jgi:hypothetical protein